MKKIKLLSILTLVLSLCFSSFSAYAKTEDRQTKKMVNKMVNKYEERIKNENLSEEAKKKHLEAYRKSEEDLLDSLAEVTREVAGNPLLRALDYTGVPDDYRYIHRFNNDRYHATEAKSDDDDNSTAEYKLGGNGINAESKVSVDVGALDSAGTAWAWAGIRYKYAEDYLYDVKFYVNDISLGTSMFVTSLGSSCQLIIDYRIYDVTTGEWVYDENVKYETLIAPKPNNDTSASDYIKLIATTFDVSATINCQPDHVYVPLIKIYAYGYAPVGTAQINSYAPDGLEWYDMWYDAN